MKGFFDKLLKGENVVGGSNNNNSSKSRGGGQSLGGSKPGKVIQVEMSQPGPLGVKVEKRPNSQGTAIIAMVVPGGQADQAGLQRGDILCFPGSHGQEEIMYEQFIAMAASDLRPLILDVRRIETAATKVNNNNNNNNNTTSTSTSTTSATSNNKTTMKSAEDYARRQAVIAAAEARERAHKAKTKPLPKKDALPALLSTADKRRLEKEREEMAAANLNMEPQSEEARRAMQAAKQKEAELTAQLGYNPFETARATAGQARNATVTVTHGALNATGDHATAAAPARSTPTIPAVRPPQTPVTEEADDETPSEGKKLAYEAYTMVVTTNETETVKSSFGIMRKLISNAITKGQDTNEEAAAKFRRVRLSNPKISDAISQVNGALELMLAVGFQMVEDGGETYLVYPWNEPTPTWLASTLRQMEQYEQTVVTTSNV